MNSIIREKLRIIEQRYKILYYHIDNEFPEEKGYKTYLIFDDRAHCLYINSLYSWNTPNKKLDCEDCSETILIYDS